MRILIVKTSSLGDIIHAFPVLQFLKQCYPSAEIDWVIEKPFAELVAAHPFVTRTICIETKKWRSQCWKISTWKEIAQFRSYLQQVHYDLVIDLQGNVKSGIATFLAKSACKVGFGFSSVAEWPNLLTTHKKYSPPQGQNIREDYLYLVKNACNQFDPLEERGVLLQLTAQQNIDLQVILDLLSKINGTSILICPGANWLNKQLSKDTWKSFLQLISSQLDAHFLFVWGGAAEKEIAQELMTDFPSQSTLLDRMALPVLQNVMGHVDLVLAMDSLPLHLAGTTSTATYSVFGASSAQKYRPIGINHAAFQGRCPYGKTFEKRCDILRTCKTGNCMKNLEGFRLFEDFIKWWQS